MSAPVMPGGVAINICRATDSTDTRCPSEAAPGDVVKDTDRTNNNPTSTNNTEVEATFVVLAEPCQTPEGQEVIDWFIKYRENVVGLLRQPILKSVEDQEYRQILSDDRVFVTHLVRVIEFYLTDLSAAYGVLTMDGHLARMDSGVQADSMYVQYLVRWGVILRVVNFLKNVVTAGELVSDIVHSRQVGERLIKAAPRMLMAKYISQTYGKQLLANGIWRDVIPSEADPSYHSRGENFYQDNFKWTVAVVNKSEVVLITFLLNFFTKSNGKLNQSVIDSVRPQLWPGTLAVLGLWLVASREKKHNNSLYTDAANFCQLCIMLYYYMNSSELSDWLELPSTSLWRVRKECAGFRHKEISRTPSHRSLTRFRRSICETLEIPTYYATTALHEAGEATRPQAMREDLVFGALMEPQRSSIQGRGALLARMQTFQRLQDTATGSLGLNSRDALQIISLCLDYVNRQLVEDFGNETPSADGQSFLKHYRQILECLSIRQNYALWHSYLTACRTGDFIARLFETAANNMPQTSGCEEMPSKLVSHLFTMVKRIIPADILPLWPILGDDENLAQNIRSARYQSHNIAHAIVKHMNTRLIVGIVFRPEAQSPAANNIVKFMLEGYRNTNNSVAAYDVATAFLEGAFVAEAQELSRVECFPVSLYEIVDRYEEVEGDAPMINSLHVGSVVEFVTQLVAMCAKAVDPEQIGTLTPVQAVTITEWLRQEQFVVRLISTLFGISSYLLLLLAKLEMTKRDPTCTEEDLLLVGEGNAFLERFTQVSATNCINAIATAMSFAVVIKYPGVGKQIMSAAKKFELDESLKVLSDEIDGSNLTENIRKINNSMGIISGCQSWEQ